MENTTPSPSQPHHSTVSAAQDGRPTVVPYSIADLVDDRNRALYESVAARATLILTASTDNSWGAVLKGTVASISCAPTRHPVASFTHELLHIRYDLDGMSCPGCLPRAATEQLAKLTERIQGNAPFFYNQLMHHRFFPEFSAMGFPANEFLNDQDSAGPKDGEPDPAKNLKTLQGLHRESGCTLPLRLVILPYLFFANPHVDPGERKARFKDFKKIAGNDVYHLSHLFRRLVHDPKPDMRWYLARLFYLCDMIDVGVGYHETALVWSSRCTTEEPGSCAALSPGTNSKPGPESADPTQ
jgi:hypothetical protein